MAPSDGTAGRVAPRHRQHAVQGALSRGKDEHMSIRSWGATDIGPVRKVNQDRYFMNDALGVYAVADGVGGGAGGEVASQIAIDVVASAAAQLRELADRPGARDAASGRRAVFDALQAAVELANTRIYSKAQEERHLAGMATTLSVLLMTREAAYIAHVGDSRIYLIRDRQLQRITQDHTWVEELLRAGTLSPQAAADFRYRNVIVRSVGGHVSVKPDLLYIDVLPGDRFLICSDGVSDHPGEAELLKALATGDAAERPRRLIELAVAAGSRDNLTAVIVEVPLEAEPSEIVDDELTSPMAHTGKVAFLRTLFFCRHLSPAETLKLLRYVHEVQARPSDVIVRQGDEGQDLFAVVDGHLDVVVDGVRVNVVGPGGHFGEINLVSGQTRTATVIARDRVRLFRLGRDDFYDLSEKDPGIAIKLLWSFLQTLGAQVRRLSQQLAQRRP